MKSKHTPGPWRQYVPEIEGNTNPAYRYVKAGIGYYSEGNPDGAPGFCLSGFIRPIDAALISAALNLLAVCREALEFAEMAVALEGDRQRRIDPEYIERLKTAIAKAEGRE